MVLPTTRRGSSGYFLFSTFYLKTIRANSVDSFLTKWSTRNNRKALNLRRSSILNERFRCISRWRYVLSEGSKRSKLASTFGSQRSFQICDPFGSLAVKGFLTRLYFHMPSLRWKRLWARTSCLRVFSRLHHIGYSNSSFSPSPQTHSTHRITTISYKNFDLIVDWSTIMSTSRASSLHNFRWHLLESSFR